MTDRRRVTRPTRALVAATVLMTAATLSLASSTPTRSATLSAPAPPRAAPTAAPAPSTRAALPVSVTETTVEDPTRWTPARGTDPAHPGRTLPTTIWYPDSGGPWPLVVFAHGFNATPWTYEPLLSSLAAAGYVVAAADFPASSSRYAGAPSQADIPNQPGDLSAVITAMLAANGDGSSPLVGRVDTARIGAMGHSDGGSTVAALVLNSATLDARVTTSAILSGAAWPIPNGRYGPFNAGPVLVAQGDADGINWIGNSDQLFSFAAPPKAFVDAIGGGHLGPFVDATPQADAMRASIATFFDRELRGDVEGLGRFEDAANRPGLTAMRSSTIAYQAMPIGAVDAAGAGPGTITASGWALDLDATTSIPVAVYVDGVGISWYPTDRARPDVGTAYPGYGDTHGFAVSFAAAAGTHTVCVYAINTGFGAGNPAIACRTVTVGGPPIGTVDVLTAGPGPGTVSTAGWAIDADTTAPIPVAIYVDGVGLGWFTAGDARPDVGAAFPDYGAAHGYHQTFGVAAGAHTVCVYAINAPSQVGNPLLGCRGVTVGGNPIGVLDTATGGTGSITVTGWAIDPDTTQSIPIAIYVDTVGVSWFPAAANRPDVAAAIPGFGPAHGYGVTFAWNPGTHRVCTFAINTGAGDVNPQLGCLAVTVI